MLSAHSDRPLAKRVSERSNTVRRLKDLIEGVPLDERRFQIRVYPLEQERLIVEGWLEDERSVPTYLCDRTPLPTGAVDCVCVRLLVGGWPLSILEAEAEIPGMSQSLYSTTLKSMKKIVGVPIVSSYSEEVNARLGGIPWCAHLTDLIVAMCAAILHGFWTQGSDCRIHKKG